MIAFNPDEVAWRSFYKLMAGSILPRPIGWISTVDARGVPNLAPYSFFNAVCPNPPHVLFCPNVRADNPKDTLANVRATGEFVVNIVTQPTAAAMNATAADFPPDVDEFAAAGLTRLPSEIVQAPRVAESPIHYECRVTQIIDVSDEPGGGSVVIGRVLRLHVAERVLIGNDKIDLAALEPVGRLAGSSYARINDIFELVRPPRP
ncbi:MAG: flavin reductase family protein [Phototrophicaceae bacterium]